MVSTNLNCSNISWFWLTRGWHTLSDCTWTKGSSRIVTPTLLSFRFVVFYSLLYSTVYFVPNLRSKGHPHHCGSTHYPHPTSREHRWVDTQDQDRPPWSRSTVLQVRSGVIPDSSFSRYDLGCRTPGGLCIEFRDPSTGCNIPTHPISDRCRPDT